MIAALLVAFAVPAVTPAARTVFELHPCEDGVRLDVLACAKDGRLVTGKACAGEAPARVRILARNEVVVRATAPKPDACRDAAAFVAGLDAPHGFAATTDLALDRAEVTGAALDDDDARAFGDTAVTDVSAEHFDVDLDGDGHVDHLARVFAGASVGLEGERWAATALVVRAPRGLRTALLDDPFLRIEGFVDVDGDGARELLLANDHGNEIVDADLALRARSSVRMPPRAYAANALPAPAVLDEGRDVFPRVLLLRFRAMGDRQYGHALEEPRGSDDDVAPVACVLRRGAPIVVGAPCEHLVPVGARVRMLGEPGGVGRVRARVSLHDVVAEGDLALDVLRVHFDDGAPDPSTLLAVWPADANVRFSAIAETEGATASTIAAIAQTLDASALSLEQIFRLPRDARPLEDGAGEDGGEPALYAQVSARHDRQTRSLTLRRKAGAWVVVAENIEPVRAVLDFDGDGRREVFVHLHIDAALYDDAWRRLATLHGEGPPSAMSEGQ